MPEGRTDLEHPAASIDVRERASAAVAALPDELREVYLLRDALGLPFGEVAAITGAPEAIVKSRSRSGLERLQAALCDCEEYARGLRSAIPRSYDQHE
jgi:RNA polymerase sigma-70 factor (ECF subfamily)